MGKAENLRVNVEELESCASQIDKILYDWDKCIRATASYLQVAEKSGFKAGESAVAFFEFTDRVSQLAGIADEIGKTISATITAFLEEIDSADDLLYDNSGYKSFTDDDFRACYAVAKVPLKSVMDGFAVRGKAAVLLNWLMRIIWKLGKVDAVIGDAESDLRRKFERFEEQTVEKLTTIKAGVRLADRACCQQLSLQLEHLKSLERVLEQIDNILTDDGYGIDIGKVSALSWDMMVETLDTPSNETIKEFADNEDTNHYFDSSVAIIDEICSVSFGSLLTNDFDKYRAVVNGALEYFNSYSLQYNNVHEEYTTIKEKFDNILNLYNAYGSSWTEYYDGNKADAERFNKIIKKTSEVSKRTDDYVDVWFQLFFDMTESQEAFARFKAEYDLGDPNVEKALKRVEALYNNEVDAYVYETIETIAHKVKKYTLQTGVETVNKAYKEILPNGGMSQIMEKVMSSILDQAIKEAPGVAQRDWVVTTKNVFDNAVARLKEATRDAENYDELVQTVRESFECAKEAQIKFYTTMVGTAKGQRKHFYELNLQSVKSMSLYDISKHTAVSPDEFYGTESSYFGYFVDGDIANVS